MRDQSAGRRQVAVAVKDRRSGEQLPQVVAKGYGTVAEQILSLAYARGIRVREDSDLIEILEAIEVDSEIPTFALAAVAEILSYVYQVNGHVPSENRALSAETP